MLQKTAQDTLFSHLRSLINTSKNRLSKTVDQEMTLLYWDIGKAIQTEILEFERPDFEIVSTVSTQLMGARVAYVQR